MYTPEQYRAKAAEYAALVKTASNSDEAREFRKLEISFAALAANSQWMADNQNKTVHPPVKTQEKYCNATVKQPKKSKPAGLAMTSAPVSKRRKRPRVGPVPVTRSYEFSWQGGGDA